MNCEQRTRRSKVSCLRWSSDASFREGSVIVVIDVLRAVTTMAVAATKGAQAIHCVIDELQALELADHMPGALLAGEHLDPPYPQRSSPNSPTVMAAANLADRSVILFSANGTRVLSKIPREHIVLCGAIVNAAATVGWLRANHPDAEVVLVTTDDEGPEDAMCAALLTRLLSGTVPDYAAVQRAMVDAVRSHERRWRSEVDPATWRLFVKDAAECARPDIHPHVLVRDSKSGDHPVIEILRGMR